MRQRGSQSEALVASFRPILGTRRLPFLAIDTRDVIKPTDLTARGGGVLGMMKFGAKTTFALDARLEIDKDAVETFVRTHAREPFLIFGFTFLIWDKLYRTFADGELDLSNATLIHSGGWKKLEAQKVSNPDFRAALKRRFGLQNIFNFYGFVEQIGSVFIEGPDGLLYPPNFTDVIVETSALLGAGRDWRGGCHSGRVAIAEILSRAQCADRGFGRRCDHRRRERRSPRQSHSRIGTRPEDRTEGLQRRDRGVMGPRQDQC